MSQVNEGISAEFPFEKKMAKVLDSKIAYIDHGSGAPVVFIHGNPTSSYLWRNVIPHVPTGFRSIALDLIGMGDSGKPDIRYSLDDHVAYFDEFIRLLKLRDITFVLHDWGSVLGLRYARCNESHVSGVVLMESLVPPAWPAAGYDELGEELGGLFRAIRSPGSGERMILKENLFVESILPKMVVRRLGAAEIEEYRRPFSTAESRAPTLEWPRQVPIGGAPAGAAEIVAANGNWLKTTSLPKLLLYATPGAIAPESVVRALETKCKNTTTVHVGEGLHFIQEDCPDAIGQALSAWLREREGSARI